jgi:hypothetical protein
VDGSKFAGKLTIARSPAGLEYVTNSPPPAMGVVEEAGIATRPHAACSAVDAVYGFHCESLDDSQGAAAPAGIAADGDTRNRAIAPPEMRPQIRFICPYPSVRMGTHIRVSGGRVCTRSVKLPISCLQGLSPHRTPSMSVRVPPRPTWLGATMKGRKKHAPEQLVRTLWEGRMAGRRGQGGRYSLGQAQSGSAVDRLFEASLLCTAHVPRSVR